MEGTDRVTDTGLGGAPSRASSRLIRISLPIGRGGGFSAITASLGDQVNSMIDGGLPALFVQDVGSVVVRETGHRSYDLRPQANVAWFGFHNCPRHWPSSMLSGTASRNTFRIYYLDVGEMLCTCTRHIP